MAKEIGKIYTLKKYKCGYCGKQFKQFVRSVMTTKPYGHEQHKAVSSQVVCPRCKAFLKTWDEGEVIGEFTGRPKKRTYEIDEEIEK